MRKQEDLDACKDEAKCELREISHEENFVCHPGANQYEDDDQKEQRRAPVRVEGDRSRKRHFFRMLPERPG